MGAVLIWLTADRLAYYDVGIDIGRLADRQRQQYNIENEVFVMGDFLHLDDDHDDDDTDDDADEPTNKGQVGSGEGASEQGYQGVDAQPNPAHCLDKDGSDEEVRDLQDAAGRGTRPRRTQQEASIPSSRAGGLSEKDAVRETAEVLARSTDQYGLVASPCARTPPRGWLRFLAP